VKAYFDVHRGDWDRIYQSPPGSAWARLNRRFRRAVWARMTLALAEGPAAEGHSVLDVGCGTGELAIRMAERGAVRVMGVDASSEMVHAARTHAEARRVGERCTFVHADFLNWNTGGGRFDFTVALGVLDYVADAPAFLRRMWQHTGRRLIVSLPYSVPPRSWLRRIWHGMHGSRIHYYAAPRVLELARALAPAEVTVHSIHGSDRTDLLVCDRAPHEDGRVAAPVLHTRRWSGRELDMLLKDARPTCES
jgi:ubiquinone/menaquinone biosynthesis C-methylase UbiE